MQLSDFPITRRWPPTRPTAIQLYSLPTANGQKVAMALEETGLDYEPHLVSFDRDEQHSAEFLSLNPNNKIPAIIDPLGPGGQPLPLFESGAILLYLAEKSGKLMPQDPAGRWAVIQWLMWQMGGIGPMLGQVGWFVKFAGREIDDPRPRQRYLDEAKRLLTVLEGQLQGRDWVAGEFSIADLAICPWLRMFRDFYGAGRLVGMDGFANVTAYLARFLARPAVQRGLNVPARN
jgi:GST-like protein